MYEDCVEHVREDAVQFLEKGSQVETKNGQYLITAEDIRNARQNLKLLMYDAFLLYADEDEDFAAQIATFLHEKRMKLCTRNDFVAGIPFEHDASMHLIANRCRRVIIIVSEAFQTSAANTFITKYAQHMGIQRNNLKIVPCLKEETTIPSHLGHLFHLKYYKHGKLLDFWKKLIEAFEVYPGEVINDEYEYSTTVEVAPEPPVRTRKTQKKVEQPVVPRNALYDSSNIVQLVDNLPSPPSEEPSQGKQKKRGWVKKLKTKFMNSGKNETSA